MEKELKVLFTRGINPTPAEKMPQFCCQGNCEGDGDHDLENTENVVNTVVSQGNGWNPRFNGISKGWQKCDVRKRDQLLGIFFIVCVAAIWVAASYLVQGLEGAGKDSSSEEDEEEGYGTVHPAMLTYISNAAFVVLLPIGWARKLWSRKIGDRAQTELLDGGPGAPNGSDSNLEEESNPLIVHNSSESQVDAAKQSGVGLMAAAAIIAPFWWLAQFTFNTSLVLTSVSSNTILSSNSSLFTFLLSLWVLKEPFMIHKLFSLLMCMAGAIIVALVDKSGDDDEGSSHVSGDMLTLVSCALYATYTVCLKKLLPNDKDVDMLLFFGYMGLLLSVSVGCIVSFLHFTGLVNMAMSWNAFGWTVLKGLLDNVLSDYLWARAVLLVGPTIASVGLFLQVPITFVVDLLYVHPAWMNSTGASVWMVVGVVSILGGFVGLNRETPMSHCCDFVKFKCQDKFEAEN